MKNRNIQPNLFRSTLEQEAIEFIQNTHKDHSHRTFEVGFSGGKDSIVVYDLVKKSGIPHVVYYNEALESPTIKSFIKKEYPEVYWRKIETNFFEEIKKKGFPDRYRRWCCAVYKKKRIKGAVVIMGTRKEESAPRKKYERIFYVSKKPKNVYPILFWSTNDVWEYIRHYNLKVPEDYQYVDRVGCIFCPLAGVKHYIANERRYPAFYKKLREFLEEFWEEFRVKSPNISYEEYIKYPYWFSKGKEWERYKKIKQKENVC